MFSILSFLLRSLYFVLSQMKDCQQSHNFMYKKVDRFLRLTSTAGLLQTAIHYNLSTLTSKYGGTIIIIITNEIGNTNSEKKVYTQPVILFTLNNIIERNHSDTRCLYNCTSDSPHKLLYRRKKGKKSTHLICPEL